MLINSYNSRCPQVLDLQNEIHQTSQIPAKMTKIRPVSHYKARAPESSVIIRFKRPTSGRPKSAAVLQGRHYNSQNLVQRSFSASTIQNKFNGSVKYRNSITDGVGQFPQNLNTVNIRAKQVVDFSKLHQTLYDIHEQEQHINEAFQYQRSNLHESKLDSTRQLQHSKFSISDLKKIMKKNQKVLAKSASTPEMMMLISRDDNLYYKQIVRKPRPQEIYNSLSQRRSYQKPKSPILKEIVSMKDMYDENDPALKIINDIISPSFQRKNSIMNYMLDKKPSMLEIDNMNFDTERTRKNYRLSSAEPVYQSNHEKMDQGIDAQEQQEVISNNPRSQQSSRLKVIQAHTIKQNAPKNYYAFKGKTIPTSQIRYHNNPKENNKYKQINMMARTTHDRKQGMYHLLQQSKLIPVKSSRINVNMFDQKQALYSHMTSRAPNSRHGERKDANAQVVMESPTIEQINYTNMDLPHKIEIHTRNTDIYQHTVNHNNEGYQVNTMSTFRTPSQDEQISDPFAMSKPSLYQYPLNAAEQPQMNTNYISYVAESFPERRRVRPISASINSKAKRMRKAQSAAYLIDNIDQVEDLTDNQKSTMKALMKNSFIQQQMKSQTMTRTASTLNPDLQFTQEYGIHDKARETSAYLQRIAKLSRDYEKHFQRKPVFKYLQEFQQREMGECQTARI